MRYILFFWCAFWGVNMVYSQRDSVIVLQEVVLSDSKLQQFSEGRKLGVLKDSVLQLNQGMLTDNLQFTSPIFFRQNGYGMVSSASFRGTSAQQTAVVWNGININSQLTGQTDFNTVLAQNLDEISIRSGGGSTQYGTGAIGGSIHLNQQLNFNSEFKNDFRIGYGSFETNSINYKTQWGSEKTAIQIGIGHFGSANDFKYLDTDQRNENGAFANQNIDIAIGHLISKSKLLKLFHNTFIGDRDFSGTLTTTSNDNFQDFNTRSLLEYTSFKQSKVERIKAAYLTESFRYFPNKDREEFSFGKSGSVLLNYDYLYQFKKWKLNGIVEANTVNANGSSIENENRNRLAGILLVTYEPSDKLSYGLDIRKDWVTDFESPFVFSTDFKYKPSDNYSLVLTASRNYRIPTFNDLFWEGIGAIGNRDLQAESAWQAEIGQNFNLKDLGISLNGFYISTQNLIQWRPDLSGIWSPLNLNDVTQYGLEFETDLKKNIGKHQLHWQNIYAFTTAVNNETGYQLIYVPFHKVTTNLAYQYMKWGSFLQGLYNGEVYTTSDNSQNLPDYFVLNAGLTYRLPTKMGIDTQVQLVVNNLTNENYQNVAFRPMPNRNIQLTINFKF